MSIHLENTFNLPVDAARAWEALVDLPVVASCVPGASIDGQDADGAYRGKVRLQLGPVAMEYRGRVEVVDRDDSAQVITLRAEGHDTRSQGGASAAFTLEIRPKGAASAARVLTDVDVTGRAAQFGRGIMEQVARRMVNQFAANLGKQFDELRDEAPGSAATPSPVPDQFVATGVGLVVGVVWLVLRRKLARS